MQEFVANWHPSHPEYGRERHAWKGGLDFAEAGFNDSAPFSEYLSDRVTDPERFLGLGGAGMVYALENGTCVKLMRNRHNAANASKYNLGNTAEREADLQNQLRGVVVEGAFVPTVVGFYRGPETSAILMEQLNAVNLQMVLKNLAELPTTFQLEPFFDSLYGFVDAMHNQFQIAHCDLEPRNVMVDKDTGQARLIDFGRAIQTTPKDPISDRAKRDDLEKLDVLYEKIAKFLNTL